MHRLTNFVLAGALAIGLAGCAARSDAPAAPEEGAVAVPATSPLSKIKVGMRKAEVRAAIGEPNDENSYATGMAFVPFYFGNEARRTSWYYKGVGRVVFADGNVFGGGGTVSRVDYDPSEPGHPPAE